MFIAASLLFIAAFCFITVAVPFRFPSSLEPFLLLARRRLVGEARNAVFDAGNGQISDETNARLVQAWGASAAVIFTVLALLDAGIFHDDPLGFATAIAYMALAASFAALGVAGICASRSLVPWLRASEVLAQSGVRGLWVVDNLDENRDLRWTLQTRAASTSRLAILDVTGYDLLGKGPGPSGGLLYDAIDRARDVPVYLLLCKPDGKTLDPERRKISVLENLLSELRISSATYSRRLSMTIGAVENLNRERDPKAQIRVKFYQEKPSFRAILFDHSCMAIPWHPREERAQLPYLDVARESLFASFYESFRRHFGRLWGTPIASARQTPARGLPERAVSGSFAIRPVRRGAVKRAPAPAAAPASPARPQPAPARGNQPATTA